MNLFGYLRWKMILVYFFKYIIQWCCQLLILCSICYRWTKEYGSLVEWYCQGKCKVLWEKPVPVLLCPQIPHGLGWACNWAMVHPILVCFECFPYLKLFEFPNLCPQLWCVCSFLGVLLLLRVVVRVLSLLLCQTGTPSLLFFAQGSVYFVTDIYI